LQFLPEDTPGDSEGLLPTGHGFLRVESLVFNSSWNDGVARA
jgi:hypothetical protein